MKKLPPSNNLKKLLSISILAKSCLETIFEDEDIKLTEEQYTHCLEYNIILANINSIAYRKHPSKDLDRIYLFTKDYVNENNDINKAIPVDEAFELLMLSIDKFKRLSFFGLSEPHVKIFDFSAKSANTVIEYLNAIDREFNAKKYSSTTSKPQVKKEKVKIKKERDKSSKIKKVNQKSKKVKLINSANVEKIVNNIIEKHTSLPIQVNNVLDENIVYLTLPVNDVTIDTYIEYYTGITEISFKKDFIVLLYEIENAYEEQKVE